jgi:hypothetical protein
VLDILDRLYQEWISVKAAPVSFLAAIAGAAVVTYRMTARFHEAKHDAFVSTIASLEERLKAHERNAEPEAKDNPESPDEIRGRIADLQAQIRTLQERRFDAELVSRLTAALRQATGHVTLSHDTSAPDAGHLAGQLMLAFQTAGWAVKRTMVMGVHDPPAHGLGVRVPDPDRLTAPQAAVVSALKATGIQFELQRRPTVVSRRAALGFGGGMPDAEIVVAHGLV